MATTYTSSKAASTVQARAGLDITSITASYTFTAAQVINDLIKMVKIPAGAKVLDIILSSDDLDTGVSPAITLDVGDGDDPDRFIAATTIAQGGGTVRLGSGIVTDACHGYTYTAEDTIDILVKAAPDTAAYSNLSVSLTVLYTMNF